jgi:hypothetical protein
MDSWPEPFKADVRYVGEPGVKFRALLQGHIAKGPGNVLPQYVDASEIELWEGDFREWCRAAVDGPDSLDSPAPNHTLEDVLGDTN